MTILRAILFSISMLALTLQSAGAGEPVTVFAAASLTDALREVDSAYGKASGIDIRESFASSSTLARQIEAGAPAQVFVSADTKWMNYLAQKGLIATQKVLLGNELALVAPLDSAPAPRAIDRSVDWLHLLGPGGRLALGDPDHVPAGIYAKQALEHFGVWKDLEPRVAPAEDVRGALALVERGEAPLGIVYVTDARASTRVRIVGIFPAASHAPIVYPAGIVRGSENRAAQDYFRYIEGLRARAVFARYGFAVH
ncbi:MAG TPA: molybdate ABC transporter substrate-binding protein [Rhizomicrobium sp.]